MKNLLRKQSQTLLSGVWQDKNKQSSKLKQKWVWLDIRKSFIVRTDHYWMRLLRETEVKVFKTGQSPKQILSDLIADKSIQPEFACDFIRVTYSSRPNICLKVLHLY